MGEMGLSDRCQAQSAGTWGRGGFPAADQAIQIWKNAGFSSILIAPDVTSLIPLERAYRISRKRLLSWKEFSIGG